LILAFDNCGHSQAVRWIGNTITALGGIHCERRELRRLSHRRYAATRSSTAIYPPSEYICEKLAAETFRRETADFEDRVDYRAHYNAHLNNCFYAETYIARTPVGINIWVYLSDLQQNRIYGGFHRSTNIGLFYCSLQDKECHSEAEWNELVKPYMED
jgi:hypothetical protein